MIDPIYDVAHGIGRWAVEMVAPFDLVEQRRRVSLALDALQPGLAAWVLRDPRADMARAIGDAVARYMVREVARWVAPLNCTKVAMGVGECMIHHEGLGAVPPTATATEPDDIVRHNVPPNPKKPRERIDWEAHQYRGLWYPAFMTSIASLTPDDVGVASAFLAGRLTTKGCPQSDKAKKEQEDKNKWRRGFMIFQQIAGVIAAAVMTVFYGPLGGLAVTLAHRAKMALIERVWKEKIVRDPSITLLLDKLQPTGPFTYLGFRYSLRPYGNMLLKELGCDGDLQTRLMLHGRMLRTLDVMVASSPKAQSRPGLYDYPSSFGMLRGSIFPPRGPQFDGTPAPPPVVHEVKKIIATPVMQAALAKPAASLTAQAQVMVTPHDFATPKEATKSAAAVRAIVAAQQTKTVATAVQEKPKKHWPLFVVGGVALGAALLASRDRT